tara:strand:- start:12109 stop:12504 length:396 start_codon:yes stop_codon:yes gene_type:complete
MKRKFLFSSIAAVLSLSACSNEDNPLTDISPQIIAKEVFDIGEDSNDCMQLWANPETASPEGFIYKTCGDTASKIAIHFTQAGYGEITANNVKTLPNWKMIETEVKALRKERRDNMSETMKNSFPDWSKQN